MPCNYRLAYQKHSHTHHSIDKVHYIMYYHHTHHRQRTLHNVLLTIMVVFVHGMISASSRYIISPVQLCMCNNGLLFLRMIHYITLVFKRQLRMLISINVNIPSCKYTGYVHALQMHISIILYYTLQTYTVNRLECLL